jgi:RNA polymerase sigma factor (TIGR02999 family)
LLQWRQGNDKALERITDLVYRDLKRLAAHYLDGEQASKTLQPTALVHEAYLHIASIRDLDWKARGQFIAVMAQMMRRILIDHARRRKSAKRDSGQPLNIAGGEGEPQVLDMLLVDQVLDRMSSRYPRHAEIVQLRFFGGLESKEIAEVMDISLTTVERDWRFARAWLQKQLSSD